jgi:hypothetical protein
MIVGRYAVIHLIDDLPNQLLSAPRPYVLCGVFVNLTRLKNVYHSPRPRKKMLVQMLVKF